MKLEQLRKLCNEATQGEWKKRSHPRMPSFVQAPRIDPTHPYDIEILGDDDTLYPTREQDLDFIAAMNPARVAKMLDVLEAVENIVTPERLSLQEMEALLRKMDAAFNELNKDKP